MSELVTKELGELHTHPKLPKPLSLSARKNSLASFTHPKLPISLSLSLCARKNSLASFTHTQNSQSLSLSLSAREKFSDELHTYPKLPMPLSLAARKILYNVDKNIQSTKKLESIDIAKHRRCKSHKPIKYISQQKSLPLSVQKRLSFSFSFFFFFSLFFLLEMATVTSTKLSQ